MIDYCRFINSVDQMRGRNRMDTVCVSGCVTQRGSDERSNV